MSLLTLLLHRVKKAHHHHPVYLALLLVVGVSHFLGLVEIKQETHIGVHTVEKGSESSIINDNIDSSFTAGPDRKNPQHRHEDEPSSATFFLRPSSKADLTSNQSLQTSKKKKVSFASSSSESNSESNDGEGLMMKQKKEDNTNQKKNSADGDGGIALVDNKKDYPDGSSSESEDLDSDSNSSSSRSDASGKRDDIAEKGDLKPATKRKKDEAPTVVPASSTSDNVESSSSSSSRSNKDNIQQKRKEKQQAIKEKDSRSKTTKETTTAPQTTRTKTKGHNSTTNRPLKHAPKHIPQDLNSMVIEPYKLIFFLSSKVGKTAWRKLARHLMGHADQDDVRCKECRSEGLLHYLDQYNATERDQMLNDPTWTRAIFVRDPKERLLSAYLDKAVNTDYVHTRCCQGDDAKHCSEPAAASLTSFFDIVVSGQCPTERHWRPQYQSIPPAYWDTVNFVGHMENLAPDAKKLLQRIGAWEEHGATGWGTYKNESVFAPVDDAAGRQHATNAKQKIQSFYTPELETAVEAWYEMDYTNPVLNLTMMRIFDNNNGDDQDASS